MQGTPASKTIPAAVIDAGQELARILRLNADPEYLQKKFIAHRTQTCLILILMGLMGASNWLLDNDIDPVAARQLLWARVAFLWLAAPAVAILRTRSHHVAALLVLFSLTIAQCHDIAVLRLLEGGLPAAVMSFVFYPLAVALLCLGFSLFVNWAALVLVAVVPLALASAGWLPHFPVHQYAMLMWSTTAFMALICVAFAWSYHRRHLLERALEEASNTDPLTGVANRRHFQVLLNRETARLLRMAQPCALLMLDIDHFKRVNDTFGHPAGDRVIRALADICSQHSRDVDVVARLGGEEFAVLMPGTAAEGARHLAERIRSQVQDVTVVSAEGAEIRWTVSVGVASLGQGGRSGADAMALGEQLVKCADGALYEAKNAGRNRVVTRAEAACA